MKVLGLDTATSGCSAAVWQDGRVTARRAEPMARGQAEAEAMKLKADAIATYGEAAVLDLLVRVMPDVVRAASEPMGNIDKMTVISTDGASSLTKSVAGTVAQGLQLSTDLTGIDLAKLLGRLSGAAVEEPVNGRIAVEPPKA